MKSLLFILILFVISIKTFALNVKDGDVILISFNCYECRVIESETNSKFSHSGVILKGSNGELKVAQALGKVHLINLQDFLKYKTPNTKVSIYRSIEIDTKDDKKLNELMHKTFNEKFSGLRFDSNYLWNNYDDQGNELLYCSEFVAKFLDNFMSTSTNPYPLNYQKNYDYWLKYFKGVVPQGELGNSPQSIADDIRFFHVGDI